jgi:tetratricopeptide (TPR) repeat protein
MLEMVREYAAERLDESGDAHTVRGRLAGYMVALAAELEPSLVGTGQGEAYRRLDLELPNLRLALGWLREQRDPAFPLLAASLARYWTHRGLLSEGRRWVAEARVSVPDAPPAIASRLLHADGLLADQQGFLAESVELLREAATLYRELGDKAGLTRVLVSLSNAQQALGNLDVAAETAAEAAGLARQLGDVRSEAAATGNLAIVALKRGRPDEAQEGIAKAVELGRRAGDMLGVVIGLGNLGAIAGSVGDFERAAELHSEAVSTAITLNDPGLEAWSRVNLSGALYRRGDWADAAPMAANGIAQLLDVEDTVAVVNGLGLAGSILAAGGDPRSAIVAWSAAETNAERLGIPLDRDDHDEMVINEGRAAVDPATREAATREGAQLDITEGVAFVVDRLTLLTRSGARDDREPSSE